MLEAVMERTQYQLKPKSRVPTCLENLEMSGNLTAVREMSGILLKSQRIVRERILSGKVA